MSCLMLYVFAIHLVLVVLCLGLPILNGFASSQQERNWTNRTKSVQYKFFFLIFCRHVLACLGLKEIKFLSPGENNSKDSKSLFSSNSYLFPLMHPFVKTSKISFSSSDESSLSALCVNLSLASNKSSNFCIKGGYSQLVENRCGDTSALCRNSSLANSVFGFKSLFVTLKCVHKYFLVSLKEKPLGKLKSWPDTRNGFLLGAIWKSKGNACKLCLLASLFKEQSLPKIVTQPLENRSTVMPKLVTFPQRLYFKLQVFK